MYEENHLEKEYAKTVFENREKEVHHHEYGEELVFLEYIKKGDMRAAEMAGDLFDGERNGKLSDNPVRHCRYLFVASMTLITRFIIEGGMLEVEAYALSDSYIQKMDCCNTVEEIRDLYKRMVGHIVLRMRSVIKTHYYSKPVLQCMDYIHEHLHDKIDIPKLGQYVGLAPTYLSAVFKKETGVGIAEYIRVQRLEAAKNMLKFSDYSYGEISTYLAFSSHSHFISLFKKDTGMTPKEYRRKYYRKNWE